MKNPCRKPWDEEEAVADLRQHGGEGLGVGDQAAWWHHGAPQLWAAVQSRSYRHCGQTRYTHIYEEDII